jgi:membrane-bound lytic murein transglycosylase A
MAGVRALAAVRWVAAAAAAFPLVSAATPATAGTATPQSAPASVAPATMSKEEKPKTPAAAPAAAKLPEAGLERVTFADLPGWESDDHLAAFKTFLKSCDAVMRAADKPVSKALAQCKVPVDELAAACRAAQAMQAPTKASAKAFFETQFVPHRIAHQKPEGLLTGYYEPVLEGSRTREGKFQTPVYRRPPDLVNVVAEADRASKQVGFTHLRKTAGGEEVPFPTRAEIEQGALAGKGLELLYLADPVEVFFMHIQGSARIHLTDGTTVRINYDGKNGHPYSSIGRYLIEQGLLDANKVSMQGLGKWLREDKARGQQVMWQNKSFIFFRELGESDGPMGAMQVVLTPGRSLAVDSAYHTLGTPIYLNVPRLSPGKRGEPFNRLMVAQDVGSAIRGPERGDIYFGSGDKAGKLAGTTKHAGNFFVLLPAVTETAGQGLRFGEHLPWQAIVKGAR